MIVKCFLLTFISLFVFTNVYAQEIIAEFDFESKIVVVEKLKKHYDLVLIDSETNTRTTVWSNYGMTGQLSFQYVHYFEDKISFILYSYSSAQVHVMELNESGDWETLIFDRFGYLLSGINRYPYLTLELIDPLVVLKEWHRSEFEIDTEIIIYSLDGSKRIFKE